MARKVFQDFAHILCQRFIEVPTNRDLVNLALLGGGKLHLDITARRMTMDGFAENPLPYADDALRWLEGQIAKKGIPREQMVSAELEVNYTVVLTKHAHMPGFSAAFDFSCTGSIVSPDRIYQSNLDAKQIWGLRQV